MSSDAAPHAVICRSVEVMVLHGGFERAFAVRVLCKCLYWIFYCVANVVACSHVGLLQSSRRLGYDYRKKPCTSLTAQVLESAVRRGRLRLEGRR